MCFLTSDVEWKTIEMGLVETYCGQPLFLWSIWKKNIKNR